MFPVRIPSARRAQPFSRLAQALSFPQMQRKSLSQSPFWHFWLIATCGFLLLFATLQRGDLAGYDDAVYAHEGRQMLWSGDWLNVWLNGRLDFDKPPLFIWLEAASFAVLGVSDFAAKFPAALLGWLTILLVYFIARQLSDEPWLPPLAMLVLASTQYFLKYATHAMTDVPFTFFFTLAIWSYLKAEGQRAERRPAAWLLCGLAIAAALLTRSILGLLIVAILGAHLGWRRRGAVLHTKTFWLAMLLAFGPPLVWFVLQYRWHGTRFIAHHFSFTNDNLASIQPNRVHWALDALGHYPWLLLKLYWPWLPLLLIGFAQALRRVWQTQASEAALLLLWIGGVLLPFSLIESKVLRYVLPAFPAFSILAAQALLRWLPRERCAVFCQTACGLLLAALLFTLLQPGHRLRAREMMTLAPLAENVTPPSQRILFYAGGTPRWGYVHQLIWYTQRNCDLLTAESELAAHFKRTTPSAFIVDRASFAQRFEAQKHHVEILGETPNFICFRTAPAEAKLSAQPKTNF